MPADDDYGRRQIPLQQQQQQTPSPIPFPAVCPAGCLPANLHHQQQASMRYASENNLLGHDRPTSGGFGHDRQTSGGFGHDRPTSGGFGPDRLPSGASERFPLGERALASVASNRCQGRPVPERYPRWAAPADRYGFCRPADQEDSPQVARTLDRRRPAPKDRSPPPPSDRLCHERFALPCPAGRFAAAPDFGSQPPSPAPHDDLSPASDCFSNNAFPSPTEAPPPERFAPPLEASPTEPFGRGGCAPAQHHQQRHQQRHSDHRYKDRYRGYEPQSYHVSGCGERYLPPTAHVPVERYVPQPQPHFAPYQSYGCYKQYPMAAAAAGDPYMRRDLAFHYRLPLPYAPAQYHQQRARYSGRPKCCQYQEHVAKKLSDGYHNMSNASPGSSSSSSLASQKDAIATSAGRVHAPPPMEYRGGTASGRPPQQLPPSASVEYVGASGGRHVCATPPPPRGGGGGADGGGGVDGCCAARRSQGAVTVTVWRGTPQSTPPPPNPQALPPQQQQQQPTQRPATPVAPPPLPPQSDVHPRTPARPAADRAVSLPPPPPISAGRAPPPPAARQLAHSQSERAGDRGRPPPPPLLNRSVSRREVIQNYIKKETANFFGVGEDIDDEQQLRWLDRRKRMACRTMGPLKDEYCTPTISRPHRRTVSEAGPSREAGHLSTGRPDVLPGDLTDAAAAEAATAEAGGVSLRRKDSVARMTWDGLSYVVTTLSRHRPRPRSQQSQWSRSFAPPPPETAEAVTIPPEEESFFDTVDRGQQQLQQQPEPLRRERVRYAEPSTRGWRREDHEDVVLRHAAGGDRGRRKLSNWLDRVLDNSDRRQYGMGWVGKMFGRSIRKSVAQEASVREQLDDMEDHRPMFTYWVTTVQILVLLISIVCYGFGPFGLDLQSRSGQVLVTSLSLQQVDYMEPANFWFGPRAGDLIHLGAKFAPCMRLDNKIKKEIDKIQAKERETACCIRNDDSGCVQSSQADCSKTISTWKKWTMGDAGPGGRISGSVCGLDPKFCDAPASVHPYEWPDDITKWPICRKTNTQLSKSQFSGPKPGGGNGGAAPRDKLAEHMVCEIIGHPCCIGIHGQCRITTKEYCDFVRGAFHEEASLCSQVSCLNDVCGMVPFYLPDTPDQLYRLWTSLFLHAGLLQLLPTVLVQHLLMRDLERLAGGARLAVVYVGAGVAGNLASAVFAPYRADVGPAGAHSGLLACLVVEVLNAWPMLRHPRRALLRLLSVALALFAVGLLPWVDNYALLFGFAFGFLLAYAFLPFVSFGRRFDRHAKVVLIWACLAAASLLLAGLLLLFYVAPVHDCAACSHLDCLPLTRHFCASQNIDFRRNDASAV